MGISSVFEIIQITKVHSKLKRSFSITKGRFNICVRIAPRYSPIIPMKKS